MEAALISMFPNCNNTAGDISVSPAYTSAFIHVSGLQKPKRTNKMRQNPPLRFYKSASLVTPHINTTQSATSSTSPLPTLSTPIPAPRVHNSPQTPPSPPLSPSHNLCRNLLMLLSLLQCPQHPRMTYDLSHRYPSSEPSPDERLLHNTPFQLLKQQVHLQ